MVVETRLRKMDKVCARDRENRQTVIHELIVPHLNCIAEQILRYKS